jgi:hypothetical protein
LCDFLDIKKPNLRRAVQYIISDIPPLSPSASIAENSLKVLCFENTGVEKKYGKTGEF